MYMAKTYRPNSSTWEEHHVIHIKFLQNIWSSNQLAQDSDNTQDQWFQSLPYKCQRVTRKLPFSPKNIFHQQLKLENKSLNSGVNTLQVIVMFLNNTGQISQSSVLISRPTHHFKGLKNQRYCFFSPDSQVSLHDSKKRKNDGLYFSQCDTTIFTERKGFQLLAQGFLLTHKIETLLS